MKQKDDFISFENRYVAHNYHPLPVVLTRGKGCFVWDVNGKKYLDMVNAYSALSHGHCNPKLLSVLRAQSKRLTLSSRAFYTDKLALFIKKLCDMSHMDMGLPMNTGAEAVETAIKAARKWGYEVKKIPENQAEIIVANENFHGRTTTIISFSTEAEYKKNFGPHTPGFKTIPFGSPEALEKAISMNTCAFIVEPVQGEAGVIIPPKGWLKEVSAICKKHQVLLILDEIQTGLGRTGKLFAFEHEGIIPDGLILGKALGGGILPVSAFLSKKEVMEVFTPGTHGSTFGGNPLAAAIGIEALSIIEKNHLAERSYELGKYFLSKLQTLESPAILAMRGIGLWIGIDINPKIISARGLCEKLMEKGLLCKDTHHKTIRLAPPLVITKKELDWAYKVLEEVFNAL